MNFDRIAPFYPVMERFIAGKCLHRARTAFLDEIDPPATALLVGEGHGTFLRPFREKFPGARLVVLDGSSKMLEISKSQLGDAEGVTFVHSMIQDWQSDERFDLIVTNFMLDCLTAEQIGPVVEQLAALAKPSATWLIADFQIPEQGAAKWRSRVIVGLLYRFFRIFTRISADRLISPDPSLQQAGFVKTASRDWDWGLLKSECWRRG